MFGFSRTDFDREVWERELAEFLPERMVDVHTHIWTRDMNVETAQKGCVAWPDLVADECSAEDLFKTYLDLFPGKTVKPVLMPSPTRKLDENNRYAAACAKKFRLPALYCTKYNMTGEFLQQEVDRGGFSGLKPYLNHCAPNIPSDEIEIFDFLTREHLETANRNGWIVMLHIARPQRLRDPVNIRQLMEIEEKYPNVKLIVAHVGRAYSKEDLGDAFETLKHTERMMFDFTANTLDLAMKTCIEAVGPKRVMFGSDLPITKMRMYRITENGIYYNVVPRGMYGDVSGDPHMRESDEPRITNFMYEELLAFKRCAGELGLSKSEIEDVLCNNGARLFDIRFGGEERE